MTNKLDDKETSTDGAVAPINEDDVKDEEDRKADGESKDAQKEEEDETKYMTGPSLLLLVIALVATVFLVALSNTIISTAIPTITSVFDSYSDIGWYTSGEAITATAFQLPFGRAYTLCNVKWTFLVALGVYLIGSLLCAVAQNSVTLIVGRAIAGIGQAGVASGVFIIISRNIPLRKRSLYAGFVGATFAIAAVVGPVLGGVFTDRWTWRGCFWLNLPVGGVAIVAILIWLPASLGRPSKDHSDLNWVAFILKFNPFGTLVLLASIVCLFLALQWGGGQYAWSDGRVVGVLVVFGVLLVGWAILQYFQGEEATVPYSVAKQRSVFSCSLYSVLLSAAFGIVVYYLPIWYQSVLGESAETAGLKQLGIVISVTVFAIAAGGFVVLIGYYVPFLILGTILGSVGAGLLYTIDTTTNQWAVIGYQIIFGTAVGVSLEQCNIATQTVLPDDQIPAGASLILFTRLLGTALAGPVAQSVLQQTLAQRLGNKVAASLFGGGATGVRNGLEKLFGSGTPAFTRAIDDVNDAVTKTFMVALILACLTAPFLLLVEWKSVKKEKRKNEDKREGKVKQGELKETVKEKIEEGQVKVEPKEGTQFNVQGTKDPLDLAQRA